MLNVKRLYRVFLAHGEPFRIFRFRLLMELNPEGFELLHYDMTVELQRKARQEEEQERRWAGLSVKERHLLEYGDENALARQAEREANDPNLQFQRDLAASVDRRLGKIDPELAEKRELIADRQRWSTQRSTQNKAIEYLMHDPNLIVKSAWGNPGESTAEVHASGPYLLQSKWPGAEEAASKITKPPVFVDKVLVVTYPGPTKDPYAAVTGADEPMDVGDEGGRADPPKRSPGRKLGSGGDTVIVHLRDIEQLARYEDILALLELPGMRAALGIPSEWARDEIRDAYSRAPKPHAKVCSWCEGAPLPPILRSALNAWKTPGNQESA